MTVKDTRAGINGSPNIAQHMGKHRAKEIQEKLEKSDFSCCPVGPHMGSVLSFLVDSMVILIELQCQQLLEKNKKIQFRLGPFAGQFTTSLISISGMFFFYLIGKGKGWW